MIKIGLTPEYIFKAEFGAFEQCVHLRSPIKSQPLPTEGFRR
jgi:hypothetical protein